MTQQVFTDDRVYDDTDDESDVIAPRSETSSEAVEHFIRESLSENTHQAYRSDLAHFMGWGGVLAASPELVAQYPADHAKVLAAASLA